MSAPGLFTFSADADLLLAAVDAVRTAAEPTPIWDALAAERRPQLAAASLAVVEATAATLSLLGAAA